MTAKLNGDNNELQEDESWVTNWPIFHTVRILSSNFLQL